MSKKFELFGADMQGILSTQLAQLIETRQPVCIGYKDELRLIEPHALGANGKVRAFQRYPEEGWRLFDLAKISKPIFETAPLYKQDDKDLIHDGIIAQV